MTNEDTVDEVQPGTLYVVGTPIGNLEDMTYRAVRVLGAVDALACEDTRTTRKILDRYGIPKPPQMFAYHEHNEEPAARGILKLLVEGRSVALCSDGGMPGISDPGYRVIRVCAEAGYPVDVLPGASAVHTGLLLSALPTSSYVFKGFPPRKSGARRRFLEESLDSPHTLVLFESPFRIGALLADAHAVLGEREAAVCLELTKKFQRVSRGHLGELVKEYKDTKPRGEITVVIAGNHPRFTLSTSDE
jgi:16S rRNA (cytidine1402-2'-O)-methyltransferase